MTTLKVELFRVKCDFLTKKFLHHQIRFCAFEIYCCYKKYYECTI